MTNTVIYPSTENFRLNLRKAFNEAENNQEVVIKRYGKKFKLVLVEEPVTNEVGYVMKPIYLSTEDSKAFDEASNYGSEPFPGVKMDD